MTLHWTSSVDAGPEILTAPPAGGWTWFTEPRAVEYDGKTFVGYVRGDNGDVGVRAYDHATRALADETILSAALDLDDHANPSLLVRASDQRILAFYTAHNDAAGIRMRVSTDPLDVSSFDAETVIDPGGGSYDYASPHQLTGEANDPILLFHRDSYRTTGTDRELGYIASSDGGATWDPQVILIEGGGRVPYWKHASSDGRRIDFAVSDGHPSHHTTNVLHHFYYEGGQWFATDGTEITSPPFAFAELTEVYATGKSWVHDVAMGLDGHPRIVFAYFPTDDDHRYFYARWTGTAWDVNEIVVAGDTIDEGASEPHYSGGVVLDHRDPRVVYASVQVDGQWEIRRHTTTDGGATFAVEPVTRRSASKQVRPVAVRGHHGGPLSLLWLHGTYTSFVDYAVGIRQDSTVLPAVDTDDFAAADHTHDESDITDLAHPRYEVIVDGNPATAVTTPDGTDWVYGLVPN